MIKLFYYASIFHSDFQASYRSSDNKVWGAKFLIQCMSSACQYRIGSVKGHLYSSTNHYKIEFISIFEMHLKTTNEYPLAA